jgi:hypothetical protein
LWVIAGRRVRFGPKADIAAVHRLCHKVILKLDSEGSDATRKNNLDFGVLASLGIDFDRPGMLFRDYVVTDGKTQTGALSGWFSREERIEHLVLHLRRNASAVVANPNLHAIAEIFRRGSEGGRVGPVLN